MTDKSARLNLLPAYRVRARNTSADSENKIHDDKVATSFGFKGGLVPGVTVYGYMTGPLVKQFSYDWLERGTMQVKFHRPFYEGEQVIIFSQVEADSEPIRVMIRAERGDGTVCASGLATVNDCTSWLGDPELTRYPEASLPLPDHRPAASREHLQPGLVLGTIAETLDLSVAEVSLLERLDEQLDVYRGSDAVAHPTALLSLANYILMSNFQLGPWIHAASDLINWSAARDGEVISARGRITDRYERKGHEFVAVDLLLVANGARPVQQIRHTAIYQPRSTPD